MTNRLHRTLILSASTLALLAGPMLLTNVPMLSATAAIAGNGNGNGNGGGSDNGNGGGGGGGGGGDHGNSGGDHGNSGGNGGGNDSGNSRASRSETASTSGTEEGGKSRGKKSASEAVASAQEESPRERTRNLKAELGGLNSLKRNINGMMNSSDPRMDGIREFIIASVALEDAEAEAKAADQAFLDARADYLGLLNDLELPADTTPAMLEEQIANFEIPEDDPETEDDEAALAQAELDALEEALGDIETSGLWTALVEAHELQQTEAEELAEAQAAAGPEAFDEALLMAANKNRRSEDYLTDDIRNWAGNIVDRLVVDYAKTQE